MTGVLAWLIDTNVVSEMMRPHPAPLVGDFLDSVAHEGIGIASVTICEILDGIGRSVAQGRLALLRRSIRKALSSRETRDATTALRPPVE